MLGALLPGGTVDGETPRGLQVLGTTAKTVAIVTALNADILLFAGGAVSSAREMRRAVCQLEGSSVQVLIAPSLTDVASNRIRPRPAAGLPLVQLDGPGEHRVAAVLKRLFDVSASLLLVLLTAPVFAVVALVIKRDDSGPVLFTQRRVGRHGAPFHLLKFRSMVLGAEQLAADGAVANRHGDDHVLFTSEADPRITKAGQKLRRFSLDELPQLINVLRGDMSLVGPRPPLQSEVDRYDDDVRRRLTVRPGMTGLWQVSGRSDLSWEDSVRLDLCYVDNWSLTRDVLILARTVHAVLSRRGAY